MGIPSWLERIEKFICLLTEYGVRTEKMTTNQGILSEQRYTTKRQVFLALELVIARVSRCVSDEDIIEAFADALKEYERHPRETV